MEPLDATDVIKEQPYSEHIRRFSMDDPQPDS